MNGSIYIQTKSGAVAKMQVFSVVVCFGCTVRAPGVFAKKNAVTCGGEVEPNPTIGKTQPGITLRLRS